MVIRPISQEIDFFVKIWLSTFKAMIDEIGLHYQATEQFVSARSRNTSQTYTLPAQRGRASFVLNRFPTQANQVAGGEGLLRR
jgi:hypothetical protein